MARKRLIVSSAGGIQAGAPFVVGQALIVQQATPAFAKSARFGQLPDAMLSFIAPSVSGAASSWVAGEVSDMGSAPKVTVIGKSIKGNGLVASDRWVAIGGNIDLSAAAGGNSSNVLIGWDMSFNTPTNTANNVLVGNTIIVQNAVSGAAVLGNDVTVTGGDVVALGDLVTAGGEATAVGKASFAGTQAFAGAKQAHAGGQKSIAIGFLAHADQDNQIALGASINANAFANSVLIGRSAEVFEANAWNLGGDPANGTDMRVLRLGPNVLTGYPGLSIFLPSSDASVNNAGPSTTIRGGISTGTTVGGGKIIFQTSLPVASGATYQTLIEVFRLQSGGTAGNPTIAFSNQISTPGASAGTLTNAPAVGNPSIWAEVSYNGVLRKIPMW